MNEKRGVMAQFAANPRAGVPRGMGAQVRIVAFTAAGTQTALRIARGIRELSQGAMEAAVSAPARFTQDDDVETLGDLGVWTREAFVRADALVFVSAAGIAVRAIAPHLEDKFTDPAVLSVDEAGRFVVPLLSGHVGGGNALARTVASILGAQAVVSTATDVNGKFAVDEWAKRNGMVIVERSIAKRISSALLDGEPVGFATEFPIEGPLPDGVVRAEDAASASMPRVGFAVTLDGTAQPFERTLHLIPRVVSVGVGCKQGTEPTAIAQTIARALDRAQVPVEAVAALSSIDAKRSEAGISAVAHALDCELAFYDAETLAAVPGTFSDSDFVKETVGVGNVCERAAVAHAGAGARLAAGKTAGEGATAAVAVSPFTVRFDERASDFEQLLEQTASLLGGPGVRAAGAAAAGRAGEDAQAKRGGDGA